MTIDLRRRAKPRHQSVQQTLVVGTDLLRALLRIYPAWWGREFFLPLLLSMIFTFGAASLVNDDASQTFVPRLVSGRDLQAS
ncbi:hypothetical protein [Nocardioides bruguierae]|uniref:Uncharacterized protein n=1 Tax=Nocardioides bruguierae TaxID=2945102 RepID=A0A9X2IFU9_9ACTN|nr:hypothetical protein [Nocardioides bruguierae]MCM0620904.1 hypothetical protein [Nocardioides bruguierae]